MVKFQIYPSIWETPDGLKTLWYWRCKSENGRITFDGAEAYSSASNALRAIRRNVKDALNCLEAMPVEILDANGKVVRDIYA